MSDGDKRDAAPYASLLKGLIAFAGVAIVVVLAVALFVNIAGPGAAAFFESFSSLDTTIIVALITGTISIVTYVFGKCVQLARGERGAK